MRHRPDDIVAAPIRSVAVGPAVHAVGVEGVSKDGVVEADGQSVFTDIRRSVIVVVEIEVSEVVIHLR